MEIFDRQATRSFNRFELKYLLSLQQAERFKTSLQPYMMPDQYGANQGHYDITNLYYDSPELRCYWEKENGVRVRRKLRLRSYGRTLITEDTPIFLEIKQRVNRVIQKRRAVLPYGEALRLCNDRELPEAEPEDRDVIEEIYAFLWQYNLRPMSMVHYHRQAFMGTAYDSGLRITFDTQLACQSHALHLHEAFAGRSMFPVNMVVMEIKINERLPIWLSELIAHHNLEVDRISKYSRSIEAAAQMPSLQLRCLPPESAQDILSSTHSIFPPIRSKTQVSRN
ncbi:MAG: polyphosphate polymerase domain-containing protein [Anaerolineae bacterium]|jgi:SPX domain protein involved in polyphosphate accumulation|nr:polyphosphate polymerase domain-containing protein [Anaerolineae bacterium]